MKLQNWLAALMAWTWMTQGAAEPLPPVTDPDAYAIYAALLDSQLWPNEGNRLLFISQETQREPACRPSKPIPEVWRPVEEEPGSDTRISLQRRDWARQVIW